MHGWIGRLAFALIAVIPDLAPAATMTATCEPPQGPRIDISIEPGTKGLKKEESRDSISGVSPVFVIDTDKRTMTVIWGSTKSPGVPAAAIGAVEPKFAQIVHLSERQITGVEVNQASVWTHSIYPETGIGIFSRASHWALGTRAIGSVMFSKCVLVTAR